MAPRSTYRVQLRPDFGFEDAAAVCGYLADLGLTHLYCSPYLQAAPGSTHGYDVTDPKRFNAELGGAPGHAVLVGALRRHGLGQVLDIVPNHMSTDPSNSWWWDVLENGPSSRFASFFDIDWQGPDERSAFKVLVPVLGDHYGRVLEADQVTVARHGGAFCVHYFDHELPVSPRTLDDLLAAAARRLADPELAGLAEQFGALPPARLSDRVAVAERHERKLSLTAALAEWCRAPERASGLDAEVASLNADPDRLDALLRRQNYRLAHWRAASEDLDYRRFFNIETLVGLRAESEEVFEETHGLVLELVREGVVDGLRVDHVDGLRDPEGYLRRLSGRSGAVYTVVEKILEPEEQLPTSWPIAGTSGYDFLTRVNNLFVDHDNAKAMTEAYVELTGAEGDYEQVVYEAKQQIMGRELVAEVERLTGLLADLCDGYRRHADHTRSDLGEALREVVAHFPVYRTYVYPDRPVSDADRRAVGEAVAAARSRAPHLDAELVGFLGELALGAHRGAREWEFAERLQQLTAPVMAKGVEDTAFYRYHRLVSLNEVGGDPSVFGRSVADYHRQTAEVAARWPEAMLTLSTHDTKRSGDVRARLHVLSEEPAAWRRSVERWMEDNERHRPDGWSDANAEYLLYQTVIGAWPIGAERLVAFMAKATREAKVHTSWVDPSDDYDRGLETFVRALLADRRFLGSLEEFLEATALVARGRRNSLVQTALLLTCPGVADVYQGTELWDLSLVDPDNRRPVDYGRRRRLLAELDASPTAAPALGAEFDDDGRAKLWLLRRLLRHRREAGEQYCSSDYEPLELSGPRAADALGFARGPLAVVVPCRGDDHWGETVVRLPSGRWQDLFGGGTVEGGRRSVAELLSGCPVAVLTRTAA